MDLERGASWIVVAGIVGLLLVALFVGIGAALIWSELNELTDQVRDLPDRLVVPSSTLP